ncbi:hypothetical protein BDW72DRAFT_189637 [Aspergillus terricola var. indicus]
MPIFISNGKQYRISLLGGFREERPSYGVRTASAVRYQGPARASPRWVFAYPGMRIPLNPYQRSMAVLSDTSPGSIPWSTENDRVLRQLRAAKVSWKRISMVMDNRPIAELKQRWVDIRDGRCRNLGRYDFGGVEDVSDWYLEDDYDEDYGREERHVSFSPSLDEDTNDDYYVPSRGAKTKRVYFIDDEFTLDEVLLLHRITADWERDRWETICSRFNAETGRNITPRQARSVVDE